MAADSNDSKLGKSKIADFPSEHVLAHEGSEWQKSARSTLAAVHLAVTAETGDVPMLEEIIDMPLDALPMLAMGHRDYERRMVDRLKLTQENTKNHLKRRRIMLESWDEVFHMLHACTKRCAPLLHQTMYEACDMRNQGIIGAHYDGPRAWRILDERINAGERTKADKLYYDKCLSAQKASRLHDNCNSDVYAKRAIAFVLNIMPNLAQKFTQEDAAEYIVEMMPPNLREAGKRVTYNCKLDGTFTDLMNLIKVCEAEVFELQSPKTNAPQLTMLAGAVTLGDGSQVSDDGFDLAMMGTTCGMALQAPGGRTHAAFTGFGSTPATGKWCAACPHPRNLVCFCDPAYVGPPPPSVWEDKVKWKGLMAARDANARSAGVTAPRVAQPTKEAIDKFKEVKVRREKARKEGAGRRGGDRVKAHSLRLPPRLDQPPPPSTTSSAGSSTYPTSPSSPSTATPTHHRSSKCLTSGTVC